MFLRKYSFPHIASDSFFHYRKYRHRSIVKTFKPSMLEFYSPLGARTPIETFCKSSYRDSRIFSFGSLMAHPEVSNSHYWMNCSRLCRGLIGPTVYAALSRYFSSVVIFALPPIPFSFFHNRTYAWAYKKKRKVWGWWRTLDLHSCDRLTNGTRVGREFVAKLEVSWISLSTSRRGISWI